MKYVQFSTSYQLKFHLPLLKNVFPSSVPTDYLLDKPIINVASEDGFNKMVENINNDINDDFINSILEMCNDLPKSKKDKLLRLIKEINEY